MAESHTAVRVRGDIRERNGFILSSMTASHAIFHAFQQSLLIMLPNVRDTLALSDVQTTGIATVRQIASGAIDLPGGVAMDLLKRHWGLIMAICTGGVAVGWLILGWAPVYPILLFRMAVVSASASLWHLPSMAALSHRFAERRGFALSVHGVGGNIGDILGPAVTGILLAVLAWREIISVYAIVPLFATFLVFWAFKNIGRDGNNETDASITSALQNQWVSTKQMLKNRALWGVIVVAGLRGMAFAALTVILSLYTKDVLEVSDKTRGFYFGLIALMGLVASPMLGHLSDRFGRKVVLVPNLICLSVCSFLIVRYGDSSALVVILAVGSSSTAISPFSPPQRSIW